MTNSRDSVTVRKARDSDSLALAELSRALGYPVLESEAVERLGRLLALADHQVFVAEAEGSVVGWLHVFEAYRLESAPFGELGGLVVATEFRRQGVGCALVKAAERWVLTRGLPLLRVRTNVVRAEARAFYDRLGFKLIKRQRVLRKEVSPG